MSTKHPGSFGLLCAALKNAGLRNVSYLRHSGFYFLHGIVWGVLATDSESLLTPEDRDAWLKSQPLEVQEAPAICLFHEEVNTAKFSNGYEIQKYRLEPTVHFAGYDAAMGGHIHRRQLKPRWAYPGSLLQQAIDEGHTNHGFLIWDFDFRVKRSDLERPRFPIPECFGVDVPNAQGSARLTFLQGKDVTPFRDKIPKKPRVCEVRYDAASTDVVESLIDAYHFENRPVCRYKVLEPGKTADREDGGSPGQDEGSGFLEEKRDFESLNRHLELIKECLGKENKHLQAALILKAIRHQLNYDNPRCAPPSCANRASRQRSWPTHRRTRWWAGSTPRRPPWRGSSPRRSSGRGWSAC
jgi:DNA repair exonuclease SbcCD nuclease subunit